VEQAELLGLAVLEAVCAGVLPITSDVPAFVEIMNALGLQEWVCPEGDVSSLRRSLDRLGSWDASQVTSLVLQAQAKLAECFAWDDYFERLCVACGAEP
jgi:glycosyltransferase involved in cell wall biosynthesis